MAWRQAGSSAGSEGKSSAESDSGPSSGHSSVGDDDDDTPLSELFSSSVRLGAAPPPPPPSGDCSRAAFPGDIPLRDYQRSLLAAADAAFGAHRAVLVYLPTGGGKTRLGAAAMAEWTAPAGRCLFVVNRRTLLDQTYSALVDLGFEPSSLAKLGAAAPVAPGARVHIATVQSLHEAYLERHAEALAAYTLAVVDECHAAAAGSYQKLLRALPPKARVLGLTATPFRTLRAPLPVRAPASDARS